VTRRLLALAAILLALELLTGCRSLAYHTEVHPAFGPVAPAIAEDAWADAIACAPAKLSRGSKTIRVLPKTADASTAATNGADIYIPLTWGDLDMVIRHEIAHMLGLGQGISERGHSADPRDIMFTDTARPAGVPMPRRYTPADCARIRAVVGN
jgi:hypothetical protein